MIRHQNEFIRYFQPLFRDIKDFTYFQHFIHDDLSEKYMVVGINATSSSLARKSYTIERINQKIKESNIPLEVVDSVADSRLFKIILKK